MYQKRFRALEQPCHICGKPIDYSLPYMDPMAFVIDEIIPVSKWREGGYNSPAECADDFNNLAPAHRKCNGMKGNKINFKIREQKPSEPKIIKLDGKW